MGGPSHPDEEDEDECRRDMARPPSGETYETAETNEDLEKKIHDLVFIS